MTITTYLSAMLTADEYAAIIAVPSPVLLSDAHRAVFEHYKLWFKVLREADIYPELDYRQVHVPLGRTGTTGPSRSRLGR